MTNLRRYNQSLLVFSAGLFFVAVLFARFAGDSVVSDVFYFFVPFFLLAGLLAGTLISRGLKQGHRGFTQVYLGISMGRFFLYLTLLIGYSMMFRHDATQFIIGFLAFYLLFSFFEVYCLYHSLRKGG